MVTDVALQWVPVIMALVTLTKRFLPTQWAPLYSIAYGLLISFLLAWNDHFSQTPGAIILEGIVMGLIASGFYSIPGVKKYETILPQKNSTPPSSKT